MPILAALILLAGMTHGEPFPAGTSTEEVHQVSKSYETVQLSSNGSSGSSRGRNVLVQRVISRTDAGVELEYDLPGESTAEERSRSWQFPVRVLKPVDGPMQVLNWPELDERLDTWLQAAGLTRTHCGQWIFTWNAFRIDCDATSVISMIEGFDLGHVGLREGQVYSDGAAREPGILERVSHGPEGSRFSVVLEIDTDKARRARAESDVVVGGFIGQEVSLESALGKRSGQALSGTITVTIDADTAGMPWRRVRVTELRIKTADGVTESETVKETVERRLVSSGGTVQPE